MVPTEAVLGISPHAGRSRKLAHARRALDRDAVVVAEELEIEHLDRLSELLCTPDGKPRLVIAAGVTAPSGRWPVTWPAPRTRSASCPSGR